MHSNMTSAECRALSCGFIARGWYDPCIFQVHLFISSDLVQKHNILTIYYLIIITCIFDPFTNMD